MKGKVRNMLEKKLQSLLKEANEMRQQAIKGDFSSYYNDVFKKLSDFILQKLNSPLFQIEMLK